VPREEAWWGSNPWKKSLDKNAGIKGYDL